MWKLQISLILQAAEVWDVVEGTSIQPPANADPQDILAWLKKDVEARAIMVPTLSKTQTNHVFRCDNSKQMYDRLKDIHADSSTLNKQHTLAKFFNYQISAEQSIVTAYTEI